MTMIMGEEGMGRLGGLFSSKQTQEQRLPKKLGTKKLEMVTPLAGSACLPARHMKQSTSKSAPGNDDHRGSLGACLPEVARTTYVRACFTRTR